MLSQRKSVRGSSIFKRTSRGVRVAYFIPCLHSESSRSVKGILKGHIDTQANNTLKACVVQGTDLRVCFLSRQSYIAGDFLPDLPCVTLVVRGGEQELTSIEVIAND